MGARKKIAFFTKYTAGDAISRYRFYDNDITWNQQDFEIIHYALYSAKASKEHYEKGLQPNGIFVLYARLRRWFQLLLHKENMLAIIEYPLLPGASFSFQKKWLSRQNKIVIDITDSGAKQEREFAEIISLADVVITTTPALTRQLLPLAKQILEIPFSVSAINYNGIKPMQQATEERAPFRIGWIGNHRTSERLLLLKDCFVQLHDLYNIQIVMIGFDKAKEKELQNLPFTNYERKEETEISLLKICDAGLLPLPDGYVDFPFEMIQYMACGLPVVASSCETTIAVNHRNDNLFARSSFEWYSCLAAMIQNQPFYKEVGVKNKAIVNEYYSSEKTQKDYLSLVVDINVD